MSVAQLSTPATDDRPIDDPRAPADVEIVIPVYNEEAQLEASIVALRTYLATSFPVVARITIADNASTDGTWRIASRLAHDLPGVDALHLQAKGRGRALRAVWSSSTASVVAYMDVDLATGLDALLPLVAPLLSGHSDVAIGTRLAPGAHVVRGARREFISRAYNLILRCTLRSTCTDAQCGFKAMRREVAAELLPLVEDEEWFFDTEVLVTAQRLGLRIHEVPVDWVDDTDSRVDVVRTAAADLRGVWRMLGVASEEPAALRSARLASPATRVGTDGAGPGPRPRAEEPGGLSLVVDEPVGTAGGPAGERPSGNATVFADELLRFAGVGVVSTAAYAALFAILGPGLGSYLANTVAIVLCSIGNTVAHRSLAGAVRHHLDRPHRLVVGAGLLAVSMATTSAALAAVRALGVDALLPELLAVTTASAVAAVARFAILRTWVFRPQFSTRPGLRPEASVQSAPRREPDLGEPIRRPAAPLAPAAFATAAFDPPHDTSQ